jgi:hypothetical protein
MNQNPDPVAAALALVESLKGDKSIKTMTDAAIAIRPFAKMGENEINAAARILAAEVRLLRSLCTQAQTPTR